MTARSILVRGLIAGLLAGLATFFVAYSVGEPHVDAAIALEEAAAPVESAEEAGHSHSEDEGFVVTRGTQKTWGLLTASLAVGVALGGLVALVSAAAVGRIGRLTPSQSTALITVIGFVSFALVPFLKYPANPPAVGSGETIGDRTALYFGFVFVSVTLAVVATLLALKARERFGDYVGLVSGLTAYGVTIVIATQVFVGVNELGAFPADTLWSFRLSALLTLATLWGVLGIALSGFVGKLYAAHTADQERRLLAASL